MRKYKTYILPVLILFIVASVIVLGKYYENWNAKKIVSDAQMKAYGETYLQKYEYRYLEINKVLHADQNCFSFLKDKPFLIKATISKRHGAAIEFIPSIKRMFQSRTVEGRIEQEIFSNKDPTIRRNKIEYYDHNTATTLNYSGTGSFWHIPGQHTALHNFVVNTPNGSLLEVSEVGSVWLQGILANSIFYPNMIVIKGSNRRSDWSRKIAKEDARYYLESDFRDVYLNSEEFRKYCATPELTHIANKIITKNKDGKYREEYGPLEYEKDIAELIAVADAHGINRDYAMKIYTLLKEKPSWRERHWIICGMIVGVLTFYFLCLIRWGDKKLILSQRFLVWWRKKKISNL